MDVQYPYASAQARLQLLYCLPTAPAPNRLVIVSGGDSSALPDDGWPGPVRRVDLSALRTAPVDAGLRADVLALPGVLGLPASRAAFGDNVAMLTAAARWLAPGGLVVGHVSQLRAFRSMARPGGLAALAVAALRPAAITGPTRCLRALQLAGLHAGQCFYVQPSIGEPMGLVPVQQDAARAHFVRAVRSAAPNHSTLGHALRLALALGGLGGLMQEHLFFWAEAAC